VVGAIDHQVRLFSLLLGYMPTDMDNALLHGGYGLSPTSNHQMVITALIPPPSRTPYQIYAEP
jgi:hypothetical protein